MTPEAWQFVREIDLILMAFVVIGTLAWITLKSDDDDDFY